MRVIFLGTPDVAVPSLRSLVQSSCEVCCVFTQPDRPVGRGYKTKQNPVKMFSLQHDIPVFQPEKISAEENRSLIEDYRPDFIIVVAYGQILPGWLLNAAKLAPLNIHFSLLPLYRGASPVAYAIMNGDTATGISIMIMQEALDSGPVLEQREIKIDPNETTGEVEKRLSLIGAELLPKTMIAYVNEDIKPVIQNEKEVTWAPRITKEDAVIDWHDTAFQIHNRIRAMNPNPGAQTTHSGQRIHLWSSIPEIGGDRVPHAPGTFLGLDQNGLRVTCGDGSVLNILEIQKPSKRRISGREFSSGERLRPGGKLFQS